jgi:hypothetical protein
MSGTKVHTQVQNLDSIPLPENFMEAYLKACLKYSFSRDGKILVTMYMDKDVDPSKFKQEMRSMAPKKIVEVQSDIRFRPAMAEAPA